MGEIQLQCYQEGRPQCYVYCTLIQMLKVIFVSQILEYPDLIFSRGFINQLIKGHWTFPFWLFVLTLGTFISSLNVDFGTSVWLTYYPYLYNVLCKLHGNFVNFKIAFQLTNHVQFLL